MSFTVGTRVQIISGRGSSFAPGSFGVIVESDESEDTYYKIIGEDEGYTQYIYLDDVRTADMSAITDLEEWKRAATRMLFDAKDANNWCGEADEVARMVGLADYLPVDAEVEVTIRVPVRRWPGEPDSAALAAGRKGYTVDGNLGAWTVSSRVV